MSPRIALVSGANRGIGFEVVRGLAENGMTVMLGARDQARGRAAAGLLRAQGLAVEPIALDVTDQESVDAAARLAGERFDRLDVLVNNAGISGGGRHLPSAADLAVVAAVIDTNVLGVIRLTNALLPLLRRSPAARIVNVSSGVGSMGDMTDPGHCMSGLQASAVYPVSEAALNALTVQYAKGLQGILVNAVALGACATDFTRDLRLPLTRTAADGAAIAVRTALLEGDGPTAGFFDGDGPVRWLGGQGPVADHVLHDQGGVQPLYARQRGQDVVLQALVGGQVRGEDAQQVIGIAEQPLRLYDLANARDRRLEAQQGVPVLLPHGDEHQRLEPQADRVGVDHGPVAADDPAALQFAQPAVARRQAQPHPRGQFGDRQPAVLLEQSKDLAVDRVHEVDPSTKHRFPGRTWKHLWANRGYRPCPQRR
jgi:NAD(P)-dependent dehydrogenase (short-subunit alcohol dehydrogenase family)